MSYGIVKKYTFHNGGGDLPDEVAMPRHGTLAHLNVEFRESRLIYLIR